MPVGWSDQDDAIIGGDLTAGLAYCTPAGGPSWPRSPRSASRDRERGEVIFTTSLGLGRKLERIRANPRVALAYHAREHGFATAPATCSCRGTASFDTSPDQRVLEEVVRPASVRFLGPPKTGFFWDRYLQEYYADRVLVTVAVERVAGWPDRAAKASRSSAARRRRPILRRRRLRPKRAPARGWTSHARRSGCAPCPTSSLAFPGADGFPLVYPVEVGQAGERGIALRAAEGLLPPGGRRAGLLGHRFNAKLIGLETRQYTGWLEVEGEERDLRAPHRGRLPRPARTRPCCCSATA